MPLESTGSYKAVCSLNPVLVDMCLWGEMPLPHRDKLNHQTYWQLRSREPLMGIWSLCPSIAQAPFINHHGLCGLFFERILGAADLGG